MVHVHSYDDSSENSCFIINELSGGDGGIRIPPIFLRNFGISNGLLTFVPAKTGRSGGQIRLTAGSAASDMRPGAKEAGNAIRVVVAVTLRCLHRFDDGHVVDGAFG